MGEKSTDLRDALEERYRPHVEHVRCITIAPCDKMQSWATKVDRYLAVYGRVKQVIQTVFEGMEIKYDLFPELATDCTEYKDGKGARWHWHGIILLPPGELEYFYGDLLGQLTMIGIIKITKLKEGMEDALGGWFDYITKSHIGTTRYLRSIGAEKAYGINYQDPQVLISKRGKPIKSKVNKTILMDILTKSQNDIKDELDV